MLTAKKIDATESEYEKVCLGFYTSHSILLSNVFLNMLVKVTLIARVIPFELDVTAWTPFLSENFDDEEDDKDDTVTGSEISRKITTIRLDRSDTTMAISQLEMSLDPDLLRRRGADDMDSLK